MQKANKNPEKGSLKNGKKEIKDYFRQIQQAEFANFFQSFQSTCLNTIWV